MKQQIRRKRLRIAAELMEEFFKQPVEPGLVADGFPADGRIVGAEWEETHGRIVGAEWEGGFTPIIVLYVESANFDPNDTSEDMVVRFTATRNRAV